jgi:hypothetical protein
LFERFRWRGLAKSLQPIAYSLLPSVTIFPIIEPLQREEISAQVIKAVRDAVRTLNFSETLKMFFISQFSMKIRDSFSMTGIHQGSMTLLQKQFQFRIVTRYRGSCPFSIFGHTPHSFYAITRIINPLKRLKAI